MASRGSDGTQCSSDRELGATNVTSSPYTPWQALSVLASETGQAVRQTFTDSGVSTSGHVQQGPKYHTSSIATKGTDQSNEPQASVDSGQVQRSVEQASKSCSIDCKVLNAEIGRVQRKLLSTDPATEVILRFNFMGGPESKVRGCCYFWLQYALQRLPKFAPGRCFVCRLRCCV